MTQAGFDLFIANIANIANIAKIANIDRALEPLLGKYWRCLNQGGVKDDADVEIVAGGADGWQSL